MAATATTGPAGTRLRPSGGDEEQLQRLLRSWWADERPPWTDLDWWDTPLRDEVRRLLWLPAGPGLATALTEVRRGRACPDPHLDQAAPGSPTPGHAPGWPCACHVVLAAAWEACAGWCAAGAAIALVDAAGPRPVAFELPLSGHQITDPAREELARALRLTPNSMGNRITSARDLVGQPELLDLVSSAAVSAWAARLVLQECADLEEEQVRAVVEDVCARIDRRRDSGRRAWISAEVGRAARMARRRLCGTADQPARERAFARRRVQVFPDRNGMATLVADLDATDAHRIHRRLSSIANGLADPTDPRIGDQVRADILVDLLLGAPLSGAHASMDPGHPAAVRPDAARPEPIRPDAARPQINVVVSLATLLGLADDPAEIAALGPIPVDTARELAADGTWRAWITDATGAITATGSRGYVPSMALARLVRAREPHCRMPGCRQPASRCDLDHTVPYPVGPTTAQNLGTLCRRHHVLKTHVGWELQPAEHPGARRPNANSDPPHLPHPPPAWRWRTPAGFTITDHPEHPLE